MTIPETAQRTAVRLDEQHRQAVAAFLAPYGVDSLFLRSELALSHGMGEQWWGLYADSGLAGVLLAGALAVPCVPVASELQHFAEPLRRPQVRTIVGPRAQVAVAAAVRLPDAVPADYRRHQPVVSLLPHQLHRFGQAAVRRSTRHDAAVVIASSARMHREEMGVDPMVADPVGWRLRMRMLQERGWSYVWLQGEELLFKAELSALADGQAQIQGVFTPPRFRRLGYARAGMSRLCELLFQEGVTRCTLYFNDYNDAARRLYSSLGFVWAGENATAIF